MPDDFTRLMWTLLPLGLDREGRGYNNATWLRSKIFPLRTDVTIEMIGNAMTWYLSRGMIQCYEAENRQYFYVVNWSKYQGDCTREKSSEIPSPLLTNSGVSQDLLAQGSCLDSDSDADSDADSNTTGAKNAPGEQPHKRTERQEALATLENEFSTITSIPLPRRATDRQKMSASTGWWQPLGAIWELENKDVEKALILVRSAIAKMRRDSLTIAAPRSILNVARSIHGNGKSAEHAEQPSKVYR